jgi:hypothetical protein
LLLLGNDENRYEYIFVYYWIYLLHILLIILLIKAFNTLDLKYLLDEIHAHDKRHVTIYHNKNGNSCSNLNVNNRHDYNTG